jgi:high-affinity nickel-transport protein
MALPAIRFRLIVVFALLGALNLGGWVWAFAALLKTPMLLGVALSVYGLGLRHAFDADHIAAIDNVTRRLMHGSARPVGVGLYFALGHSSIVILATAILAGSANAVVHFEHFHWIGGRISTSISAMFLIFVAGMNILVFVSIHQSSRHAKAGGDQGHEHASPGSLPSGLLTRFLRPVLGLVSRSWHMFPLGFLFGLGFDTATEVAMFGVSAAHAAKGAPLATTLVFPVLFAAGMALVDTLDGLMMLGAYDWSLLNPRRRTACNLAMTAVSISVALFVGTVEILALFKQSFSASGVMFGIVERIDGRMNSIGVAIVLLFVLIWSILIIFHRRLADVN